MLVDIGVFVEQQPGFQQGFVIPVESEYLEVIRQFINHGNGQRQFTFQQQSRFLLCVLYLLHDSARRSRALVDFGNGGFALDRRKTLNQQGFLVFDQTGNPVIDRQQGHVGFTDIVGFSL